MRLACCLATDRGVNVVAPVHDALMVEGPADAIDDVVARTQEAMAEASEIVLAGFRLRSDLQVVRWPDRYMDGRGREFWGRVVALLPAGSEANQLAELGAVAESSNAAEPAPFPRGLGDRMREASRARYGPGGPGGIGGQFAGSWNSHIAVGPAHTNSCQFRMFGYGSPRAWTREGPVRNCGAWLTLILLLFSERVDGANPPSCIRDLGFGPTPAPPRQGWESREFETASPPLSRRPVHQGADSLCLDCVGLSAPRGRSPGLDGLSVSLLSLRSGKPLGPGRDRQGFADLRSVYPTWPPFGRAGPVAGRGTGARLQAGGLRLGSPGGGGRAEA